MWYEMFNSCIKFYILFIHCVLTKGLNVSKIWNFQFFFRFCPFWLTTLKIETVKFLGQSFSCSWHKKWLYRMLFLFKKSLYCYAVCKPPRTNERCKISCFTIFCIEVFSVWSQFATQASWYFLVIHGWKNIDFNYILCLISP